MNDYKFLIGIALLGLIIAFSGCAEDMGETGGNGTYEPEVPPADDTDSQEQQCNGYSIGDSWDAEDGCNACTCTEEGASCTLMACDGEIIPEQPEIQTGGSGLGPEGQAIMKCLELCQNALTQGMDLSNGPCLSDIMEFDVPDWVCDIAHEPRTAVDDLTENQCIEWHNYTASHFVEYSPECEFIIAE